LSGHVNLRFAEPFCPLEVNRGDIEEKERYAEVFM